jgi:hypothetical protein
MTRYLPTVIAGVAVLTLGISSLKGAVPQPGPIDFSGQLNGAPVRIVVPAVWNGTLLVFQRAYQEKADFPGEVENRTPFLSSSRTLRDALLAQGYALAGSARTGWSVEEGISDNVAIVSHFKSTIAQPDFVIGWGECLGGVITLENAERNGGAFDGFLAICTPSSGTPRLVDHGLDLRLAYDVAFGMPASWGTPGDVRDDLDFETEMQATILAQASDPTNFGRFEFIRLISGIPGSGINPPAGMYPAALIQIPLHAAFEDEAELERRAGGPVGQNIDHHYALTGAEKHYLESLGLDAEPLLEAMNARRNITAPPASRNYVEHFAEFSGLIRNPVLTVHANRDEAYPVAGESVYRKKTKAVGRDHLLVQQYTTGPQWCGVTPQQEFLAIRAIDEWVRTGTPPAPSVFPATMGFMPDYVPPDWPQP